MGNLKKDLYIVGRGLREIHRIRGGLLGTVILNTFFQAAVPFVTLYMSALLVDEITAGGTAERLFGYVIILIGLNFVIMILTKLLTHRINLLRFEFDNLCDMKLSRKVMEMDYMAVEDPETHRKKQKIEELKNMGGSGIWKEIDIFTQLIRNLLLIIFSVSLTASLFFTPGQENVKGVAAVVTSPFFSLVLIAGILLNVGLSMHANHATTKKMYSIMNGLIPFNRVFGYYMNEYVMSYHAGKDIRLYNQKDLIMGESEKLFGDVDRVINELAANQRKYSDLVAVSAAIISALIYLFVGLKALAGVFGVGMVIRYIGSIQEFTAGFTGFMTQLAALRSNNEALSLYFEFLDIPSEME